MDSDIIEKIKSGEVKMKPKTYFILKGVLFGFGLVLILFFTIFLFSFVLFVARLNSILFFSTFGLWGLKTFLISFPWASFFVAVGSVLLLEILTKKLTKVYRYPIIYSFLLILIVILAVSLFISKTTAHKKLWEKARQNQLPVAGRLYQDYETKKYRDVYVGKVLEKTDKDIRVETEKGEILDIMVTRKTYFLLLPDRKKAEIKKGNWILVVGKKNGDKINALGIRRVKRLEELPLKIHYIKPIDRFNATILVKPPISNERIEINRKEIDLK